MKEIKDWTYEDLVDYVAAEILKGLIAGEYRNSIWRTLTLIDTWRAATGKVK